MAGKTGSGSDEPVPRLEQGGWGNTDAVTEKHGLKPWPM